MALTPRVKTWVLDENLVVTAEATQNATAAAVAIQLKASLLGNGCTLRGSSNSLAAGLDAVDRLQAVGDVVSALSGAHSWMVVRHTGTGLEFCVDFNGDPIATTATVVVARQPFVGGSTTARPTAPNERVLVSQGLWGPQEAADHVINTFHSSDGLNSMVTVIVSEKLVAVWLFGSAYQHAAGWTYPFYAGLFTGLPAASDPVPWDRACFTPGLSGWKNDGTGFTLFGYTQMSYPDVDPVCVLQEGSDVSYTDRWLLQPIGLLGEATDAVGGHGRIPDVWFVSPNIPVGAMWPKDPEAPRRQVVSFGGWAFPWGRPVPPTVL